MRNGDIQDKLVMPEFSIDTIVTENDQVIPGIKRMYDIAYAIKDSLMQWGGPGCVAEGSIIRGHWDNKSRINNRKGVKIENIYKGQHGIAYLGSYQRKSNVFIVKSYNETTKNVEDTPVTSTYSGEKQCYMVTTETKSVELTEEHPVLTLRGWLECKDLVVGDTAFIFPSHLTSANRKKAIPMKEVTVKYHPTGSKKVVTENGKDYTYFRKSKHILEYEANRNGLTYKEYIAILNNYNNEKIYTVPHGLEVHHIDRDRNNNAIENIQLLTTSEHAKLHHAEEGPYGHFGTYQPKAEQIVSIEATSVKKTYDLTCEKNHNFFANDILVHNCGKSEGVKQWNQQKVEEYAKRIEAGEDIKPWNPEVVDVRLSMKEPVDMVGVPIPTKGDNGETYTVWATPSMWPKAGDGFSGGVIHLDELNQGQAAILNAAFQLIQDRALGEYKVPEGYIIIGSSNTNAYNNTVTEFSLPLSNRFSHFNIKPDFESWLNYKLSHGGNVDVMAYLKTQGVGLLFDKQGIEAKIGSLADAMYTDIVVTPRSWEVVERILALPAGTESTGGFTIEEKQRYATGRLGLMGASKLFTWLKAKEKYQDWREILEDGKPFRSEDVEQFWAVQIACIAAIANTNDDKKCRKYVVNFLGASKSLKSAAYRVMNLAQLSKLPRVRGNVKLFNPMIDAPELIAAASDLLTRR